MMDNLSTISLMEKENIIIEMEMFTLVLSSRVKNMEKVKLIFQTKAFIKDFGRWTRRSAQLLSKAKPEKHL